MTATEDMTMCGIARHHQTHQVHRSPERRERVDPDLRVSTAERERVVAALRVHLADGRIDMDEYGDRIEAALAARTGHDLVAPLADLPKVAVPVGPAGAGSLRERLEPFIPYLAVMALLVTIWAVTGFGAFWPIWPMLGWGIPLYLGHRHHRRPSLTA